MATYTYLCSNSKHPEGIERSFIVVNPVAEYSDVATCPECGGLSRRDVGDLGTVATIGSKPIEINNALGKELSPAFGTFKRNPDGSLDKNHAAFRDTGELNKFMNGQNELGGRVVDDNGNPVVKGIDKTTGQPVYAHKGEKLFKYNANDTPSQSNNKPRRAVRKVQWVSDSDADKAGDSRMAPEVRSKLGNPSRFKEYRRRAK